MLQKVQFILGFTILENRILDYIISILIIFIGILTIKLVKKTVINYLKKLAERAKSKPNDILIENIEKSLIPVFYYGVFYLGIYNLKLNDSFIKALQAANAIVVTFVGIRFLIFLISNTFEICWRRYGYDTEKRKSLKGLLNVLNVLIWSTGIIFLLDNLGFKISAVIAGLGIGGVAVALAAQTILGDLFSYVSIVFDRPFEVGDYILVDDKAGTVNYIGVKTTRITSLSGEQLIFSNSDLTKSRIQNFKRMEKRRVTFKVGVDYETKPEYLKKIPDIIKKNIENMQDVIFDRAHLVSYSDSSFNFEVVYYVVGREHNKYMDIQQDINLTIFEDLERLGIKLKTLMV